MPWITVAPLEHLDDAALAETLRQLVGRPAKISQLAHKPEKLERCSSCNKCLNLQTGECAGCSD